MRFQGRERRKDRWIASYIIGFSKGFGPPKLGRRYGDDTWKRGGLAGEGIIRTKRLIYNSSSHLNALGDGIGAGK